MKLFIYTFCIVLLSGFIFYFIDFEISILDGRYRGVYGNPNGLGISLFNVLFPFSNNFNEENIYSRSI